MHRNKKVLVSAVAGLLWAALGGAGCGIAAAGEADKRGETVEHEVIKGDNLHLLAGYYFSDPRQWKRVLDSNQGTISDANVLLPGTVLKIETEPARQWNIPYDEFVSRVFD